MRTLRCPPALMATAVICAAALAGCGSPEPVEPQPTPPPTQSSSPRPPGPGVSPGGVTTAVDAPANSTEKEYYDACHWARVWISERGGDPRAQIEPYLAMLQASTTGQPGTWNTPWAQLTPDRQAAVIVAVQAAADGACD